MVKALPGFDQAYEADAELGPRKIRGEEFIEVDVRRHCHNPIFGKAAIKESEPRTLGHYPHQVGARVFVQHPPARRVSEWRPHAESRAFARGLRAKFIN